MPVIGRSQHQPRLTGRIPAEDLLKAHYGNDVVARVTERDPLAPASEDDLPVDRQGHGDWEESPIRQTHLGENTLVIGLSQKAIERGEKPPVASNSRSQRLRSEIWSVGLIGLSHQRLALSIECHQILQLPTIRRNQHTRVIHHSTSPPRVSPGCHSTSGESAIQEKAYTPEGGTSFACQLRASYPKGACQGTLKTALGRANHQPGRAAIGIRRLVTAPPHPG